MEQQKFIRKNQAMFDAQRRQEKKHKRRIAFYVILFVSVTLIFLGVCFAVFLNVETFTVTGTSKYTPEQIIEMIPVEVGENIFSFSASETEAKIKRALPYIGEIKISRDLPTAVVVEITEETEYYAADIAGETYILSPGLKVLERRNNTSAEKTGLAVLKLNSVKMCVVGETVEFVDSRVYDAIIDLYGLFGDNTIISKIRSLDVRSRFDIYLNYDNRFDVYVGDMENADIKIKFLVGIINDLYPDSKGSIDVSNHTEATYLPG